MADAPPPPPDAPGAPGTQSNATPASTSTALVLASDGALPNLDSALANIDPIPINKLLMVVNSFVINTVDFLNKFAMLSERKLSRITMGIQRVEIMLALLEAKLDSIAFLRTDAPPAPAPSTAPVSSGQPGGTPAPPPGGPGGAPAPPAAGPGGAPAPGPGPAPAPAPEPEPAQLLVKDDPRYKQFFQMMDRGVPMQALFPRVTAEGLDPNFLATPNAPAPPMSGGGALVRVAKVESESEESESEEEFH